MQRPTATGDQIEEAKDDRLRVLVVGAGVAGLALTQLLRAEGLHPVLVERGNPDATGGYMLGLIPVVDPVLRRLGVRDRYVEASQTVTRYRLHGRTGKVLREFSFDELLADFDEYRGIERGDLLSVIATDDVPVSFGTTVGSLDQSGDAVEVSLVTGDVTTEAAFDVVVAADGLSSDTRSLILAENRVPTFDTGWGGWVAWADADPSVADTYDETWGPGWFVGVYPVPGRVGAFVGGDRATTRVGPAAFVDRVRADLRVTDDRTDRALTAITDAEDSYYWSFHDCRATTWSVGRVVLLGDAAAGFLPTAGVGAAMAMDSAGALAHQLAGTDRRSVPAALEAYEAAQRPRVESAHDNSRQLARLMFRRGRATAAVRDAAMRFVTLKMALGPIRKLVAETPDRSE